MVDFNAENTISTAPTDILKIMILQRLDDVLNSLSAYYKYSDSGIQAPSYILSARIRTLLMVLKPSLDRWINPKEQKERMTTSEMLNILNDDDSEIDSILNVFNELNYWLDTKHITRIDNKKVMEGLDPETENEDKGY